MAFSLCSTAATSSSSCKQNHLKGSLVHMRKISAILFALVASSAFADSNSEHIEHLKMMMHAMSHHGAVIPQPDKVNIASAVAVALSAHCDNHTWAFTPSPFTVNQGDVVTLTVSIPSGDCSSAGHGFILETYFDQG